MYNSHYYFVKMCIMKSLQFSAFLILYFEVQDLNLMLISFRFNFVSKLMIMIFVLSMKSFMRYNFCARRRRRVFYFFAVIGYDGREENATESQSVFMKAVSPPGPG